jgi:hypothetical protein
MPGFTSRPLRLRADHVSRALLLGIVAVMSLLAAVSNAAAATTLYVDRSSAACSDSGAGTSTAPDHLHRGARRERHDHRAEHRLRDLGPQLDHGERPASR